ncbi:type I DNA topoisomerase [Pontibacter sp. G13]|uniref:type I DNA topoisomerase n=1 Tax=Pontibacter sp. G13 TaxID=3074898 RepID=UPI00288A39A5|nr:type I DNA topoisomerase [Pontibacter sp. G13]WNJ19326.1 type I DNA topoisomerase [Pontibacter sp. G13]
MAKNLLIVESPAKAKTIEKYLGKDFTVRASYGHVRDLPKGDKAIDIQNGFQPQYEVISDKKPVIKELKDLISKHETVWLATDEDREGEAISWHLAQALGLDIQTTRRIVFNEITKPAIQSAIQNPRTINQDLVNAQQARRILDRLVGFQLSPILWKKIRTGLSAGRVQSVAVRLIVEREREIMNFEPVSSFKLSAGFNLETGEKLQAELSKRYDSAGSAREFLESCKGADYQITKLETKPAKKSPSAPFTTSTLQQEASRKLSFSVSQTMRVAQTLYEAGKITYMRTDGVNLSEQAIAQAEDVIKQSFGDRYAKSRRFKSKNANAQEAHEAIRPTDLSVNNVSGMGRNEERLYDLIWKRTLASQMAEAELEKTTVDIAVSTNDAVFKAKGEVLKFDGFLKLYLESTDDENEESEAKGVLPPLSEGQKLLLNSMTALERFSRSAPRYTEASLVKKLEELGIGRPSTYAPTISTIQKRHYVVKETREGTPRDLQVLTLTADKIDESIKTENFGAEKNKLFPSDLGMVVNDFLVKFFPSILDYSFTAKVEQQFDKIADGNEAWSQMIDKFYKDFKPLVEETVEKAERAGGERQLGEHPKSGKPIIARLGRYGPMIQIGSSEDEEKPKYAKLRSDQRLETITLEEALELFKLPRVLGEMEEQPLKANIGRFGPYVQLGGLFASLEEGDDPYEITYDRGVELILKKRQAEANKIIKKFNDDCSILRGRYGPYIKIEGNNVKIPKDVEPENLTLEDCQRLLEEHKTKPKRGRGKKKTTKK